MEVIYELSRSDVSQLFRYIRHRRNGIRPVFLFSFLSVFASVGLAVAGFSLSDAYHHMGRIPNDVAFNTVLMMCFVFFVAYFFIFRLFVLERQAWRNPQVVSEKTMRISPTGVFVRHSLGEVTLHWPLIVDVIDDRDCFYLFMERNNAFVVPKRAFASPNEARAFYDETRLFWQSAKNIASPNQAADPATWPPAPRAADSQERD